MSIAVLISALLTCIFFYEVVFLGRTLVTVSSLSVMGLPGPYGHSGEFRPDHRYRSDPGASSWAMLPWTDKVADAYRHGDAPLWNESQGLGAPLLANGQSGGLDFTRFPVWLSPSPLGWDFYYLFRSTLGGVFMCLFARAIGLSWPGRVTAAIAYVFSGHFMMLGNNTWTTTYYVLPLLLLGVELAVARRRLVALPLIALSVAWCVLVGMPEVTLLVLGFAAAYTAYRLLEQAVFAWSWRSWPGLALDTGVAWIIGVALAAPLVLPLGELAVEAASRSVERSAHGLAFAPIAELATWVVPDIMVGPGFHRGRTPTQHYVGIVALMLALYAVFSSHRRWREHHVGFMALAAGLIIAKVFGVPGVNELGALPGLDITWILKWGAPVAGFALAVLSGVAAHRLARRPPDGDAAVPTFAIVVGILLVSAILNRDALRQASFSHVAWTVGLAFALAAVLFVLMVFPRRAPSMAVGVACCVLVGLELFLHAPRGVYQDRFDWRAEPPYVTFLQDQIGVSGSRIFGTDALMFPNLSTVFALNDIRSLDALYPDRYLTFLRLLVNPRIQERFVGGSFSSAEGQTQIIGNQGFDLASVRYVVSFPGSLATAKHRGNVFTLGEELSVTCPPVVPAPACPGLVSTNTVALNGVSKGALFNHPPSSVRHAVTPSGERAVLRFSIGLNPATWDPTKGDGVGFEIAVESDGKREAVYRREIDPKHDPSQRGWIDGSVDLSRFIGREIDLIFTTDQLGSSAFDWANWGDVRIESLSSPASLLANPEASCPGRQPPCFEPTTSTIHGISRPSIFAHAPATLTQTVQVPPDRPVLRFFPVLSQATWTPEHGDGVAFQVSVEADGTRTSVYRRTLDPMNDPADRRWIEERIDLSPYAGREIRLMLETDPLTTTSYDWSAWADPQFVPAELTPAEAYTLIYDDEVSIYENRLALPRAHFAGGVTRVATRDESIALLRSGAVDLRRIAVVESDTDEPFQGLGAGGSAAIRTSAPEHVAVDTDAQARSLLVLTDLYYPGWVATIDGQPTTIYPVDLAFRGVVVPAGRHVVEFTYRPVSFEIGVKVATAGFLALTVMMILPIIMTGLWKRRRRERCRGLSPTEGT